MPHHHHPKAPTDKTMANPKALLNYCFGSLVNSKSRMKQKTNILKYIDRSYHELQDKDLK